MQDLLSALGDLEGLVKAVGLLGVYAIIYAESGIMLGFFLPGDSLLFTAGFLASQDLISLPLLMVGCGIAAILGDSTGYWFGNRVGRRIFAREDSRFFKKKYVYQAQGLYDKHGGKIIVLARFMPIVRTFAPLVAGIGEMPYGRFLLFNVVGGLAWGAGVPLAGYLLGSVIPDVDKYLLPIVVVIVLVSIAPSLIHLWRERRKDSVAEETEVLAD